MLPNERNNQAARAQEAQADHLGFYAALYRALEASSEPAENPVQDGLTYKEDPLRQDTPTHSLVAYVGAPTTPTKPPVGGVCKAHQDGPSRFLELLREVASELIPSRDLRRKVALVPLVLPLELLAFHLGLSRQTLHTWKAKLEEGGLLDSRPFKVRLSNGRVVNAGTIFLVPLRKVSRVKLDRGDFEFQDARKMAQDIEEGRLSYLWLKAKRERGLIPSFEVLVAWAKGQRLQPGQAPDVDLNLIAFLGEMAKDPELKKKLPATITLLAEKLVKVFDDYRSRRFYASLLWRVARENLSPHFVLGLIRQLMEAYREGVLQRPGAVLAKRLREIPLG